MNTLQKYFRFDGICRYISGFGGIDLTVEISQQRRCRNILCRDESKYDCRNSFLRDASRDDGK